MILLIYALYSLFTLNSRVNQRLDPEDDGALSESDYEHTPQHPRVPLPPLEIHRDLVVASMKSDNTSWLFEYFPDWHKSIYVVDDKNAELTVEVNKGRESMVYLTYVHPHAGVTQEHPTQSMVEIAPLTIFSCQLHH